MLKDKMYDFFVRRNASVRYEYERYVMENLEEHYEHRLKQWKILFKLNWHYCVKKKKTPLLFVEQSCDVVPVPRVDTRPEAEEIVLLEKNKYEIKIGWKKNQKIVNVYKQRNGEGFAFLKKVWDDKQLIDDEVTPGNCYQYRIKVSDNGEVYSTFSNVLEVEVEQLSRYEAPFGTKRLCRGGSESEVSKRVSETNLAKMLMRYDTISFDIFDTLILRPFSKPSDLFMLVGQKLGIMDYCKIRFDAEEEVRKKNNVVRGNREVTLDEIYEEVEKKTGVDKSIGMRAEIETEFDLCVANPYMLRVYNLLKSQGKRIVATSDMYLSSEVINRLLAEKGYEGITEVIVSCEYNVSKRDGGLYDILISKYGNEKVGELIHIGDNKKSDIQMAESKGINTYFYEDVNTRGNLYRATEMSYLVGSAYSGLVNNHLHNGVSKFSPYYEVGFVYAGIYVMGFCNWIHKQAKQEGITKILFLAREGDIYQKVFDTMFDDIETEYTLWSRVPVAKTTVKKNRHPYLLQLVHHKAHALYKSKVSTLFDRIGISELKKYFAQYGINEYEYVSDANEKIIEQLLVEHWDELCECYIDDEKYIKDYLLGCIEDHKKIAVVDVGWSGNNVLQVKYLIEQDYKCDCNVSCYLAATREVNKTYMATMMQNEEVKTYLFSNIDNVHLHNFHQETNNRLNSFFFEILTQSCTPTFLGFLDQKFLYDIPEVENFKKNEQIHQGIMDFVRLYMKTFEKYPFMCNISGHDAYMPFRLFVSDLSWLKTYFAEYAFGRDLFATQEKMVMETVSEVMSKAGV